MGKKKFKTQELQILLLTFVVFSFTSFTSSTSFSSRRRVVQHQVVPCSQPRPGPAAPLVVPRKGDASERAPLAAKDAARRSSSSACCIARRLRLPGDRHPFPRRRHARGLVLVGLGVDAGEQGRLERVAVLVGGAQRLELQGPRR